MNDVHTKNILALDIGGTNPRMAMVSIDQNQSIKIQETLKISKAETSIIPYINSFLKHCAEKGLTTNTCIASVAGPINKLTNSCEKPTNAKFPVRGLEIQEKTLLEHVLVVNDFKAIGEAVATIDLSKQNPNLKKICVCKTGFCGAVPCDKKQPNSQGNRAVLGPGTGLGVTYLTMLNDGLYTVQASEGGHASTPADLKFGELRNFIREKLGNDQLGMEALVSGQGIAHIMEFLLQNTSAYQDLRQYYPNFKEDEDSVLKLSPSEKVSDDTFKDVLDPKNNADISKFIGKNMYKNTKALLAMRIFFDCLGSATQAVALHGLATGGIFIAGGITKNHLDLFEKPDFVHSFLDNWKENIQEILEKIPVYIITDYDISFIGCARIAIKEF